MTNRTTLAQLREMDVKQAVGLPINHLAMLFEDVAALKADTKRLDDKLSDIMARRWADPAADARKAKGKDTGTVSLDEGEFVVRADLPKKVEWDAAKLETAIETIHQWGEPIGDYVTIKHVVSETKYNAWPSGIRDVFEPARTVSAGKPTFKIERRAA